MIEQSKYIAGWAQVAKEALNDSREKIDSWSAPQPNFVTMSSRMYEKLKDLDIDAIVQQTIPIYTIKNLNPKSGKPDCPITTREKEHFRYLMKVKLQAAGTDEERQKVIDHYKSKWSEG